MKNKLYILFSLFLLSGEPGQAIHVTIIESQSMGHTMDQVWLSKAINMGMTASIDPQTTLDNTSFFTGTDVLIVSSGVINLTPVRINTIFLYLLQGGMVYLQTEYDTTFGPNQAFSYLANSLGGSFTWTGTVSGTLAPVVSGSLGTTPNTIAPFNYFWYGASAVFCSNIESFLQYQGNDLGFIFCPGPGYGRIITTTDQDWIQNINLNDSNLLENILFNLTDSLFSCNAIVYPTLYLGNDTSLCSGDSLVLNAGSGFNSYQWQNGLTDSIFTISGPGTYWVDVTTSCSSYRDTIEVTLGVCSQPQALLTASDTSFCLNECIDFFDLSTNSPTSWQWFFPGALITNSTSQNPVNICYGSSGSFDVTLIACNLFGCDTLLFPGFISVTAQPVVSLGNDTLICLGDSLLLNPGAGFNSYLWSTNATTASITVSSQGMYIVEVNTSTCSGTDTIYVTTQTCAPANALFISSDTTFCDKKCLDFTDLSTNNPTSWQWFFPGADSTSSTMQHPTNICYNSYGSFDVTLIACNASGCDTLFMPAFITEFQVPPQPVITQSNDTLYTTPAFSYAWYNTINPGIIISTDSFYAISTGGNYFVIISDSNGCQSSSSVFTATGIEYVSGNSTPYIIFPNPAKDMLHISTQSIPGLYDSAIKITDLLGQEIYSSRFYERDMLIDIKSFSNGIYFLSLKSSSEIFTLKFIINH